MIKRDKMKLAYSQMPLDRCTNQRKNLHWLKQQFNAENTLLCPIKEGLNFFCSESDQKPVYFSLHQFANLSVNSCIFLGQTEQGAVFAFDYNKLGHKDQQRLELQGTWLALRQLGGFLEPTQAAILALAKGLVHWHRSHLYCGHCGHINHLIEAGHARKCSNNDCRQLTFPRTDPAVIMLVEKMFEDGIPRCLLGRQASWTEGMYSTLAGFVDPGETLEEAVIREVAEESAINIEHVQYVTSQPWPFPASIMLGFTAVACNDNIDISQDDLQSAKWFSRDELALFGSINSSSQYKNSSRDSISYFLIQAWREKQIGQF